MAPVRYSFGVALIHLLLCMAFCESELQSTESLEWQENGPEYSNGREAKVAEQVEELAGSVSTDKNGKIVGVTLPEGNSDSLPKSQKVIDLLDDLAELSHLESIRMGGEYVDDKLLVSIAEKLPSLKRLRMAKCNRVTDFGIRAISKLPSLEYLFFEGGNDFRAKKRFFRFGASGKSLKYIAESKSIKELFFIKSTSTTDADLAHLAKMPQLTKLSIGLGADDQITDEGVAHLSGLKDLRALSIHLADITENSLDHVIGMEHLDMLMLTPKHDSVTVFSGDKIMETMNRLEKITTLNLGYTRLSVSQIRSLLESHKFTALVITNYDEDPKLMKEIEKEYADKIKLIRLIFD